MSQLKVITQTGNKASNAIFVGMFGDTDANGKFQFDSSLMGLDVAKMTQISIMNGRESFAENQLATIDVPDEVLPSFKATMLLLLKARWNAAYDAHIWSNPGIRHVLMSAKEMDAMAVDTALEQMELTNEGVQTSLVPVDVAYDYINAPVINYRANQLLTMSANSTLRSVGEADLRSPLPSKNVEVFQSGRYFHGDATVRLNVFPTPRPEDQMPLVKTLFALPPNVKEEMAMVCGFQMQMPQLTTAPRRDQQATTQIQAQAQPVTGRLGFLPDVVPTSTLAMQATAGIENDDAQDQADAFLDDAQASDDAQTP